MNAEFRYDSVPTELPNPDTVQLSKLCRRADTLPRALQLLRFCDIQALTLLMDYVPEIEHLAHDVHAALTAGHRVFGIGCGSAGRLSLALELLSRDCIGAGAFVGLIAGGDSALVRAIESFEDHAEYGEQQLAEAGFRDEDVLLAFSAAGGAPFVVGCCRAALKLSRANPYLICCNPADQLREIAPRCRWLMDEQRIQKLCLCVGPMALTGSTRMQASTVQLLAAGLALHHHDDSQMVGHTLSFLMKWISSLDYGALASLASLEAAWLHESELYTYAVDESSAFTVMTDVTERSPTFSLSPLENFNAKAQVPSPVYIHIKCQPTCSSAWKALLGRDPRVLEWPGTVERTGLAALLGYNFSEELPSLRKVDSAHTLSVQMSNKDITIASNGLGATFGIPADACPLLTNVVLKCLLNAYSTCVMGIVGRFESNIMTYVRPSNLKLANRAVRLVQYLFRNAGVHPPPDETILSTINQLRTLPQNEPVVIRAFEMLHNVS